jgi:hypothetical protein
MRKRVVRVLGGLNQNIDVAYYFGQGTVGWHAEDDGTSEVLAAEAPMMLDRGRTFFIAFALGAVLVTGTPAAAQAREDILASARGHDLARQQVEVAIAFLEFLADGSFSSDEKHAIIEEARTDFMRDPVGDLKVYASIAEAARRAAALKGDKIKEAEFREDTIAAIHLDLLSKPAEERAKRRDSAAIRALFGRVPVIAADPTSRHVVTRRGLDALLDANDFVAGLAGHGTIYAAAHDKIAADVATAFASMSADDRYVAAHGVSRWTRLQAYWSGLAAADRSAIVAELKRKAPRPDDVPVAARQLETTARLALFRQHVNRSVGAIMNVQSGGIVLDVMRNKSRSFGN